jgi:hypothetical protein
LNTAFVPSYYFVVFSAWKRGYLFVNYFLCAFDVIVAVCLTLFNLLCIVRGDWFYDYELQMQYQRERERRAREEGSDTFNSMVDHILPDLVRLHVSSNRLRARIDYSRMNLSQLRSNEIELTNQLNTVKTELQKHSISSSHSTHSYERKHLKFYTSDQCVICMDRRPDIYLKDCYHACLCMSCALEDDNSTEDVSDSNMDSNWRNMVNSYPNESSSSFADDNSTRFYNPNLMLKGQIMKCPLCQMLITGWGYIYVSASNSFMPSESKLNRNHTAIELSKLTKYITQHPEVTKKLKYW